MNELLIWAFVWEWNNLTVAFYSKLHSYVFRSLSLVETHITVQNWQVEQLVTTVHSSWCLLPLPRKRTFPEPLPLPTRYFPWGWERLNNSWMRQRPKCSQQHIILGLLTVSMHDCPFSSSFPIRALLALLLWAYVALPVCLSRCRVSLIDADQVLYTCAYLYGALQWAKGN